MFKYYYLKKLYNNEVLVELILWGYDIKIFFFMLYIDIKLNWILLVNILDYVCSWFDLFDWLIYCRIKI